MATTKKRIQISMTKEIENKVEKMVKTSGLSKSDLFEILIKAEPDLEMLIDREVKPRKKTDNKAEKIKLVHTTDQIEYQNDLNKLALNFARKFPEYKGSSKATIENLKILTDLYSELQNIGKIFNFSEPRYWMDAYEEFSNSQPNFESCLTDMNFYLFNIVVGVDEKRDSTLYKSKHESYYQDLMFLFVAVAELFFNVVINKNND